MKITVQAINVSDNKFKLFEQWSFFHMCGINGIINHSPGDNRAFLHTLVQSMNSKIEHRGPDDEGVYVDSRIALGMRRLSIIDLKIGRQPIFNEDSSLVIIFNGEIYNYQALRKELIFKGHSFRTTSDTEVILHHYEEYGMDGLTRLKGMFVFAIYDVKNKTILIARDRAGEKPLYYYHDKNYFIFASELKSLICTNLIDREIDSSAITQYFQLTYIPAPKTPLKNVFKLPAGHTLTVSVGGDVKLTQYWDMKYCDRSLINDYPTCSRRLRKVLFEAVEESMIADVPVGTFLSGGIDSTIVTGIASRISNRKIDSFTIGFKNKEYDESDRAKLAAEFHNTNHHIFYLDYQDVLTELDQIISNMDEPFADSSLIPTYMVSRFAKQFVKAVITGDAGDELFGGYNKYLIGYYSRKYNKIPSWVRNGLIRRLVHSLPDTSNLTRKMRKVIEHSEKDIFEQHQSLMCLGFQPNEVDNLLGSNSYNKMALEPLRRIYHSQNKVTDDLSRSLYLDFKIVLEGDMLAKVDRASMLASLETRTPMLDKDVIELAAQIPGHFKINSRKKKIILKDAFQDLIPKPLFTASKKGFNVPIADWLRNELKKDILSELNEEYVREQNIFNYDFIRIILNEHFSRKKDRSSELWALYVFQRWYKLFFLQN